jgi:hypothetical protein
MNMPVKFHLYFDDTGNRDPDKHDYGPGERDDDMDCFALGGILLKQADIDSVIQAHKTFCAEHGVGYPLHSHSIRGGRGKFGWLKTPEKAGVFLPALEEHLLALPIVAVACVVDRPGYVARYKDKHADNLWLMCKTAFLILIERSAKYVDEQGVSLPPRTEPILLCQWEGLAWLGSGMSLPPRTEPILLCQWEGLAWLGSGIRTRSV